MGIFSKKAGPTVAAATGPAEIPGPGRTYDPCIFKRSSSENRSANRPSAAGPARGGQGSKGKTRFQSSFIRITDQPRAFASSIRAAGKVPTFESAP